MNLWISRLNAAKRTVITLTMALTAALAVVATRPALADGTTYSSSKRQFKVGILLLESTTLDTQLAKGPENPDPYVFHVADSRTDIKPSGWEFINPLAPGTVTPEIKARWQARMTGVTVPAGQRRDYAVGQKVTKNMAAYWEVYLRQASIQDLLQFDLLFITNHRSTSFSPADREKLRKVVDAGGIVWIENCGGMDISKTNPFFLEQLSFQGGGPVGKPSVNHPDHPLLNTPYRLTFDEIGSLGDKRCTSFMVSLEDTTQPPNPEVLINIVGVQGSNLPYIAAGNYGGGSVIATASDCGCDINDYIGGVNAGSGGNSGAYSGSNFNAANTEDLKFLYNMVSWGSATGDFRRNTRRSAASFENIGAPLVSTFDFNNALTKAVQNSRGDIIESRSAGVIAKGAYFVTGTQNGKITVRAYDLNPLRDLDGDGNIDDGRPDLSLGLPYDEIWRWTGGDASDTAQPSPPVFASVYTANTANKLIPSNGNDAREDRIFVTLPDGTLVIMTAFPRQGGSLLATPVIAAVAGTGGSYNTVSQQVIPRSVSPAPVFFENRIYQVEPNGMVRCIDARDGSILFQSFNTAPQNISVRPTGSPAVGFVRQNSELSVLSRNSGGQTNDLMMYIPARYVEGTNNGAASPRILAYWLGARNEVLRFGNDPESQNGIVKTRIAGGVPGGPSEGQYFVAIPGANANVGAFIAPRIRIFIATPNSNPPITAQDNYNAGKATTLYTGKIVEDGRITVLDSAGKAPPLGTDMLVAADYDVMYISGKTGTVPPNYASNPTQIGARPNQLLTLGTNGIFRAGSPDTPLDGNFNANPGRIDARTASGYALRSFSTPALSSDDTLFFAAIQAFTPTNPSSDNPPITTIFAVNEQDGDFLNPSNSRLRWRFPITNELEGTSTAFNRTVDDVNVQDIKPFLNYLTFDAAWPKTSSAVRQRTPEALTDIRVIGTPITTNDGLTYFLASAVSQYNAGRLVTLLMAFKTNPEITLNLPEPFDLNAGVTIQQADILSDQANGTAAVVRASSNQSNSPQLTLDADRGRVIVKNFRGSGSGFSASQSFVVRYYSREGRAERKIVIPPTPLGSTATVGEQVDATGRLSSNPGGFSPLLFYYVLPGMPLSQPSLVGDYIYYNVASRDPDSASFSNVGFVVAVDARPYSNDPQVRIGLSEQVMNVTDRVRVQNPDGTLAAAANTKSNHARILRLTPANTTPSFAEGGPVGGEGSLVVNSGIMGSGAAGSLAGVFAFNNGVTLIADSRRLLETSADASALWSMESTVARTSAGGPIPIYGPTGEITNPTPAPLGQFNVARTSLARPTSLQRIGGSDYLMADSGNNRVVRTDRGGNVVWGMTKAADPYGILASGDPLTLSEPTDLLYYVTPTLNAGLNAVTGYEVHYIIADSGNSRIIEVATYYDQTGGAVDAPVSPGSNTSNTAGSPVVVWSSRVASEQGKSLRFRSVQRAVGFGPAGTPYEGLYGYPYLTAVVSNVRLGIDGPSADAVGGSLVTMRYAPFNTALTFRDAGGTQKPAKLWLPPTTAGSARQSEPVGNGATLIAISEFNTLTVGPGTTNRLVKRINNPTFFQQLNLPANLNAGNPAKTLYLLCDLDGAYVLQARTDANGKTALDALWAFKQSDYNRMNTSRFNVVGSTVGVTLPLDAAPKFQPVSLQLLANGNYLITNGWTGRSSLFENGQFTGDVFEVKPNGSPVLATVPFTQTSFGGAFANFSVPRIDAGATNGGITIGLNRQIMGSGDGNTGLLEQPIFAIRP